MHSGTPARDAAVEFGEGWPHRLPFLAPIIENVQPIDLGDGFTRNACVTFLVPAVRAVVRGHLVVGREVAALAKIIRHADTTKLPLILWAEPFGDIRHPVTGLRLLVGDISVLGGAEAA